LGDRPSIIGGQTLIRQRQAGCFRRRLNTGLFLCEDDVVDRNPVERAIPGALVKIEDESGFASKVRIAREDPASMFPGAKGVAVEPAPQVASLISVTKLYEITC